MWNNQKEYTCQSFSHDSLGKQGQRSRRRDKERIVSRQAIGILHILPLSKHYNFVQRLCLVIVQVNVTDMCRMVLIYTDPKQRKRSGNGLLLSSTRDCPSPPNAPRGAHTRLQLRILLAIVQNFFCPLQSFMWLRIISAPAVGECCLPRASTKSPSGSMR